MGKILVIAEKPSVARDIASVLKCGEKRDGFLEGENYIISWAIGHLISLADPEEYNSDYKKWAMNTLPIIPSKIKLVPVRKTAPQLKILKQLMNSQETDSIICATDSGREGELIFRYIYEYVNCKKPVKRLWISSMTAEAIREGFNNLKPGHNYDNLYESAKCRSEADWLVGINATRAFTCKYGALLSIGRVQTPTINILVQRKKEIDAFKPTDYWQVKADFGAYTGLWTDLINNENKIDSEDKARKIQEKLKGKLAVVTSIEVERKSQPPGLLYDLTLLQRECNRYFSYSAKTTLQIAQDLYEKRKLITYPRTDSQYLSDDMKSKCPQIVKSLPKDEYGVFIDYLSGLNTLPMGKRIFNNDKVTDHHAIIPTGKSTDISRLTAQERNVYDLIIRKFLAAFYPNHVYDVTKVVTASMEENFVSQGRIIIDVGWKALYPKEKAKDGDDATMLPPLKKGDEFTIVVIDVLKKQVQPPKPYSEEMLLAAMENAGRFVEDEELKEKLKDSGIGTPATRAAIIERIIEVGYVERKGKTLFPTEKGVKLMDIVPDELKSPETTGKWEKGLSSISKGNMESNRFMESIGRFVSFIVNSAEKETEIQFEKEPSKFKNKRQATSLGACPVCGQGKVLENTKAFYCNKWKDGCKLSIWKSSLSQYGIELNKELMKKLLKDGKIESIDMYLPQTKEKCTATLTLDKNAENILQITNVSR